MKKLCFTFTALVAALCCIQGAQAALVTAGELIVDLRNQDLDASTNVWVNHATSTNSVGDFMRIDTNNLTVLPALNSTNLATNVLANALQVDQVMANALRSASQTPVAVETNNTRSVEAWVYALGVTGSSCPVGWGTSGDHNMSSFNYHDKGENGMFSGWNDDAGWGGYPLPMDEWTYLAWTYDGATVIGYINGVFVASYATTTLNTQHAYLGIGGARDAGADPFIGRIGDVRVHTGVLSDIDIAANYAEGMVAPADLSPHVSGLEDKSVYEGEDLTLEPVVSGALPLTYQWKSNSVDIVGATNSMLVLSNITLAASGTVYSIEASNVHGTDSDSMTLTVNPIVIIPPVTINLDVNKQGSGGEYTGLARAPGAGTIWNQFNVSSGSTPLPTTISSVVDSHGNSLEGCQIRWTGPPPNNKTIIKVYKDDSTGSPNPVDLMSDYTYQGSYGIEITSLPAGAYDLYMYAHNNNAGGSTITIAATNGGMVAATTDLGDYRDIWQTNALNNSYLYMTGVVAEAGGSFSFTISDYLEGFQLQNATPIIDGLADLTVTAGTNLVLGGVAGRRPMTFQWSYNGSVMVGETNETLVLNNVQSAQAGEYSLEVSNSVGSDSASMTLTVESGSAPNIDSISVSGGTANITWVSDAGSGYSIESASDLVVSNWTAVVTNLTSAGTNTTPVTVSGNDEEFFRISK